MLEANCSDNDHSDEFSMTSDDKAFVASDMEIEKEFVKSEKLMMLEEIDIEENDEMEIEEEIN